MKGARLLGDGLERELRPEILIQYRSVVEVVTNLLDRPPVMTKLDAYPPHTQINGRRKRCQRSREAASDHERRNVPCSVDEQRDDQRNGSQYNGEEETSVLNPHSLHMPKVIPSLLIFAKEQSICVVAFVRRQFLGPID